MDEPQRPRKAPRRAPDFKVDGLLQQESREEQAVRKYIIRGVLFMLAILGAALYQVLTSK
jgi:hypothetical protein